MTNQDPIGTLYLDPETGVAYRLRSYGTDWHSKPFNPEPTRPSYSTLQVSGSGSSAETLPTGAVEVWRPLA